MKIISLLIIIIPVVYLSSCRKIEIQDPVPEIEYTSFEVFDTTDVLGNKTKGGRLKFYFEDGDGDLGLQAPDSGEADSTNLFFTLLRKAGGEMVPAPLSDPLTPSSYRIPYMEREGINKMLKGTIAVTFLYLFYSSADTIMYEFYLKDRLNHDSNTVRTGEIIISKNGKY